MATWRLASSTSSLISWCTLASLQRASSGGACGNITCSITAGAQHHAIIMLCSLRVSSCLSLCEWCSWLSSQHQVALCTCCACYSRIHAWCTVANALSTWRAQQQGMQPQQGAPCRNENYWLAFTLIFMDDWFSTNPQPADVPMTDMAKRAVQNKQSTVQNEQCILHSDQTAKGGAVQLPAKAVSTS